MLVLVVAACRLSSGGLMGFNYSSGCGLFPEQRLKSALAGGFLPTAPPEKPQEVYTAPAESNMPANLENSAVATGLEKVSFHPNPKERQYQRMFKLLHDCTHLTQ